MSQKLKYPQWQEPLKAAIVEFDNQQLRGKVQKAEQVIADRVQELSFNQGNEEERRMLSDGLYIIQSLKERRLESKTCKRP